MTAMTDNRATLLAMTAEEMEPAILAMTDAEVDAELRRHAYEILAEREGCPPEQLDHHTDEVVIAAALAPEGQPCGDCGHIVVWTDDSHWQHVTTPTRGCFLA